MDLNVASGRADRKLRSNFKTRGFVLVYQEEFKNLILHEDLPHFSLKVYLFMMSDSGFSNEFRMTTTQLAKTFSRKNSQISKALRVLQDHDLIKKSSDQRGYKIWVLNSDYTWKGNSQPHLTSI